jgi:thioredoxin-related protein
MKKYLIIAILLGLITVVIVTGKDDASPLDRLIHLPQRGIALVKTLIARIKNEEPTESSAPLGAQKDTRKFVELLLSDGTHVRGELLGFTEKSDHIVRVPYAKMTIALDSIDDVITLEGEERAAIIAALEAAELKRADEKFTAKILPVASESAESLEAESSVAETAPSPAESGPIIWEKTLPSALTKAQTSGQWVMIDFSTSWCGWCTKLDQDTFQNPEVSALLKKHFVCVKLDGDKEKQLMSKYGVNGFPNIVFTDARGNKEHQIGGYLPPAPFMSEVQTVIDKKNKK